MKEMFTVLAEQVTTTLVAINVQADSPEDAGELFRNMSFEERLNSAVKKKVLHDAVDKGFAITYPAMALLPNKAQEVIDGFEGKSLVQEATKVEDLV